MHTEAELAAALAKHLTEHRRLIGDALAYVYRESTAPVPEGRGDRRAGRREHGGPGAARAGLAVPRAVADGGSEAAPSGARRSGGTTP